MRIFATFPFIIGGGSDYFFYFCSNNHINGQLT